MRDWRFVIPYFERMAPVFFFSSDSAITLDIADLGHWCAVQCRAAAGVLLALAALLAAPLLGSGSLAHAQTTVLVSNIEQPAYFSGVVSGANSFGQGFTTGPASGGYTLSSVEVVVHTLAGGVTASDITASIYSESSSNPGTLLHTLTTPASLPSVTKTSSYEDQEAKQ